MKFNSQICTTREQSERLLALGLKPETADMRWERISEKYAYYPSTKTPYVSSDIPAWSLHRLIEMMPNCIVGQGWLSMGNQGLHYSRGYGVADNGLYESIISMYEWLSRKGILTRSI